MWLSHEATELWVCVGQIVALCHLHLVRGCGSFSDSKVNFLAFHVDYFLNTAAVISLARRLAFSVHADTLETIGTLCHSPPFSVTMQQRPKTPKHSGKPGRSGPHSTLFKGLIAGIGCAPTDCTQRWTGEQNKVTERWRQQFKLRCFPPPPPRVKRWIPGAMPPWLYCVTEAACPPSNTWDSFTLAGRSDGAASTRPPSRRNERGGRKGEMLVVEKCQWQKGGSRLHMVRWPFVLWCSSSK